MIVEDEEWDGEETGDEEDESEDLGIDYQGPPGHCRRSGDLGEYLARDYEGNYVCSIANICSRPRLFR